MTKNNFLILAYRELEFVPMIMNYFTKPSHGQLLKILS